MRIFLDLVFLHVYDNLRIYIVSISVLNPDEARLRIVCDPVQAHFGWRLVQGLDFENENITFSVTGLDVSYCPSISSTVSYAIINHGYVI